MPLIKDARHERFAQELAKGISATEAYVAAGYKKNRSAASRLSTNVNIVQRVKEIQARVCESLNITLQWLEEKAEEARKQAMELGQTAAAVAAIKELGVLSGHRVEKRENTNRNAADLTDDELADIASAGRSNFASTPDSPRKPH